MVNSLSPTDLPAVTLLTARALFKILAGLFLAIFSSSIGTWILKNSSKCKKPPPTRTKEVRLEPLTEDLSVLHLDEDSLGTELVDSLSLSDEEGGQLVRVLGGVDEVGEHDVDVVVVDWDVGLASSLQLEDEFLEVDDVLGGVRVNGLTSSFSPATFLR